MTEEKRDSSLIDRAGSQLFVRFEGHQEGHWENKIFTIVGLYPSSLVVALFSSNLLTQKLAFIHGN